VGTLLPIFAKEDPYYKGKEDEWENWENAYLPEDEEELRKMNIPKVPLLLYFPHIIRRVAAPLKTRRVSIIESLAATVVQDFRCRWASAFSPGILCHSGRSSA
jgi:hypothetical protein